LFAAFLISDKKQPTIRPKAPSRNTQNPHVISRIARSALSYCHNLLI
jgi:hypothetical protein